MPVPFAALLLLASPAAEEDLVFVSPMGEVFHGDKASPPDLKWFAEADGNHDGRLSQAEMIADADRFFATLDRDGNGEIGPEELRHYEMILHVETGGGGPAGPMRRALDPTVDGPDSMADGPPGPMRYRGIAGAARFNYFQLPEPVIAADLNLDRGVSRDEFERAAMQRFQALDSNSDGRVDAKELPDSPARKVKRMAPTPRP
ncbi:hypothetical protein [Sphingomonas sp.]|uniref:hypothetical protein n=1 Tax=Sphingomonas sp. TaxID=28214 RepID=UPI001B05633E|nr:hypothetical protein [Sphingomonas sp.]MBO9712822.1 hypothetical protein [Sphingomonas sp.]